MAHCPVAPGHVASCREDRNGVYPRGTATRHGVAGPMRHIVNLALHEGIRSCDAKRKEMSISQKGHSNSGHLKYDTLHVRTLLVYKGMGGIQSVPLSEE